MTGSGNPMTARNKSTRPPLRVFFSTFAGHLDSNALVPIIALYATDLGADIALAGLIVGMYSIVHAFSNVLLGPFVDRFGRKRPLTVGLAWDGVSLLLYALAFNPLSLLLARVSHGFGGGFVGPATMALVADHTTEGRRGRSMAYFGMSIAASVIAGFALAGVIVPRLGYQALFLLLFAILLMASLVSVTLRETFAGEPVSILLLKFPSRIRREQLGGYASISALYFGLGSFTALVPLHLDGLGFTPGEIILAFVVFAVASLLAHFPGGIMSDVLGPRRSTALGLVLLSFSFVTLPMVTSRFFVLGLAALFGVAHGIVFPSSSAAVTRGIPQGNIGMASGVFYLCIVAGVAVGAPLMALVASVARISAALQLTALVAIFSMVLLRRPSSITRKVERFDG